MVEAPALEQVRVPADGQYTIAWAAAVQKQLDAASRADATALEQALPAAVACAILEATAAVARKEATVVDVVPTTETSRVVVVGDTHGQFHDVCAMLDRAGQPSSECVYIFNGDFVDRGAWGLETLILLCCLKLALPKHFFMLRGNHECTTCTHMYGFRTELMAKFQRRKTFREVYGACKKLFSHLPLAAVVAGNTLVLHGGLFSQPVSRDKKRKRPGAAAAAAASPTVAGDLRLGSLADLRAASKGGMDPNGFGASALATEVLWSDPVRTCGLMRNDSRGVGLIFGPDITMAFLQQNDLKLIIRSHEGPDARSHRDDLHDMLYGFTHDHIIEGLGQLMTVFSAPDYPQFQAAADARFNNLGAVAVLTAPGGYAKPAIVQYKAVPRPKATAFYAYEDVPDSDEEMEVGKGSASDAECASDRDGSDPDDDEWKSAAPVSMQSQDAADEAEAGSDQPANGQQRRVSARVAAAAAADAAAATAANGEGSPEPPAAAPEPPAAGEPPSEAAARFELAVHTMGGRCGLPGINLLTCPPQQQGGGRPLAQPAGVSAAAAGPIEADALDCSAPGSTAAGTSAPVPVYSGDKPLRRLSHVLKAQQQGRQAAREAADRMDQDSLFPAGDEPSGPSDMQDAKAAMDTLPEPVETPSTALPEAAAEEVLAAMARSEQPSRQEPESHQQQQHQTRNSTHLQR